MMFKQSALLFLVASMTMGASAKTKGFSKRRNQQQQQPHLRQLSGKGGKKGGKKGGLAALSALISVAPSYDGADMYDPFGTVTLRFNDDDSFLAHISATGLDPACARDSLCTVAIYDGTSCDEPGSAYYDMVTFSENPWSEDDSVNKYDTFTGLGKTLSAFTFDNGYDAEENSGKVFVLYDSTDALLGCGVLEEKAMTNTLKVDMGPYPGYTGDLEVTGDAYIIFNHDDTFQVRYNFKGLEIEVVDAGAHFHTGVTCDDAAEVLGHYWDDEVVDDLWTTIGGSVYSTDDKGNAKGSFYLYNGYGIKENVDHAFVIHASDGSRVACGLLEYA